MRRALPLLRAVVVPLALLGAGVSAFAPAFSTADVVRAGAVAVAAAGVVVALLQVRGIPTLLAPLPVLAGMAATARFAAPVPVAPTDVPGTFATFVSVGLPAGGLPELAVVVGLATFPAALASLVASRARRPLLTVAGPVALLATGTLAVAPLATSPLAAIVLAVLAAVVLAVDVRSDLGALPPLVGTRTEERRQVGWWRPLSQAGAGLAVLALAVTAIPFPDARDVRNAVAAETVRIEDPNPLAVAARWRLLDEPGAVATVTVDGVASPGRLRLSVLDEYRPTGWVQAAAFGITGSTLAPDPVVGDGLGPADDVAAPVMVTVDPGPDRAPFRATPTAGRPVSVAVPDGIRYAPGAGILVDTAARPTVRYATIPATGSTSDVGGVPATAVPDVPVRLVLCPAEAASTAEVAAQLTADVVGLDERLDRLEDWLLTRRIFDPEAPGGQTVQGVERFVETPFARGNLEVFATAYALLARCAGIPARVVVGLAAPAPDATTTLGRDAVLAWVEIPVAGVGWVGRDPLPTPEEQERLARLAAEPPPPPAPEDETDGTEEPEPTEIAPLDPPTAADGPPVVALVAAGAVVALVLATLALLPAWTRRRRRRAAEPTTAVLGAWTTVVEALADRGLPVRAAHTPTEVLRAVSTDVPVLVRRAADRLVPLVDIARYGGGATPADAGLAWALAALATGALPAAGPVGGMARRVRGALHPVRAVRRFRTTAGVVRGRASWDAPLPDELVAASVTAPTDIPGVRLDTRLGEGSTGTVYRGTTDDGRDVAVKVFRFGPGDDGFDQRRFDWEVRIAEEVSGMAHLPAVHGAGITAEERRPYLVTTRYDQGTLLDRVRRGGPLTVAEAGAVAADVALALETLHQLGVVHADVKPENVFVGDDGWVLGDLGSAWLRAGRGPARSLTPPYAAPEVWRGNSPTPAGDLYSLALTAWFAATGRVPVAGSPPDQAEVAEVLGELEPLVRALDPDPRRRPRSAGDLARRLRPADQVTAASVAAGRGLSLPTPTVTHPRS